MKPIKMQMRNAIKTEWNRNRYEKTKCPSLKLMCEFINENFKDLTATLTETEVRKDRHVAGTHFRHEGCRNYKGYVLRVFKKGEESLWGGKEIYQHDSTETYRQNTDVAKWILQRLKEEK